MSRRARCDGRDRRTADDGPAPREPGVAQRHAACRRRPLRRRARSTRPLCMRGFARSPSSPTPTDRPRTRAKTWTRFFMASQETLVTFVDTSGWYAAFVTTDANYSLADVWLGTYKGKL